MRQFIIISLVLCFTTIGLAQVPENINFQSVFHHTQGGFLPNEEVKIMMNILEGEESGDIVYREEHSITSNDFGLINIKIGTGTVLYGSWENILWEETDQYLMIELDASGAGDNYEDMGVSQLLSVPYALYADQSSQNEMWMHNAEGIHYTEGKVGIGTQHPVGDLELGNEKVLLVSSSMEELDDNAIIKIGMAADTARPNIQWEDIQNEEMAASMSVREFSTDPYMAEYNYILSSADEDLNRRGRMSIKYDETIANMQFDYSNLIVNGNFISGTPNGGTVNSFWANNWIHEGFYFGIGDKDWETTGIYGNAAAEFYANGGNNFVLINSANELKRSQLVLRRGNAEWMCRNEGFFTIRRNSDKHLKIMNNGDIKLGSSDPEHKLDVYGDVNIPVGYSYLIGAGKSGGNYAEYFAVEEKLNVGALAGVNKETGLVKNYEPGDMFIGVVCKPSGFIANANSNTMNNSAYALVGLEGLMQIESKNIKHLNCHVYTIDNQLIGALINGKILIK